MPSQFPQQQQQQQQLRQAVSWNTHTNTFMFSATSDASDHTPPCLIDPSRLKTA